MPVAPDAWDRLVAHLWAISAGGNMNLLFDFTVLAFHRHHDIALVGYRCSLVRRYYHALRSQSGAATWAQSIVDTTQYHSRRLVAP